MKNVTQLLATLYLFIAGFVPAFGQNEIAQATTRNEKVIVDDGWAYFVTPKQLFTEKGTIDKVWITDIAPPISTYTEEEKKMQLAVNQEFGKEFVLTYDHVPDNLEYTNNNFQKPIAERNIDNEEITPYTWKWVHLEMPEPGGGKLTANLRRPNWWLIDNKANKEGNWVKIEIEEMGINGLAQVKGVFPSWVDTRITDFKEEGKNKYRPITGWFERTAPEVWNYVFSTSDTIGSTPNHPFFSEDKQDYIAVGDLSIGERVKLAGEKTATLVSKWMRENGQEKVYNLEVWRDHNFHVGVEGLLVHNSCPAVWKTLINAIDFDNWMNQFQKFAQNSQANWAKFQRHATGSNLEVEVNFNGTKIRADWFDGSKNALIDAKYIGEGSPLYDLEKYLKTPSLFTQLENEFIRYGNLIGNSNTPIAQLIIRINKEDEGAKLLFQHLGMKHKVPTEVEIVTWP